MHRHHSGHKACAPVGLGRGSGHFGRGFRAGPGGGRRGRMFDQGDLRLVILQLISEKPRYGYDIIKAIEEKLSGLYSPSPGVVYPTLTLLEDMGLVEVQSGEGKKLYAITDQGRDHLKANEAAVQSLLERMQQAGAAYGGGAPQILRAMENFKAALRLRLARGPLSEDEIKAIAAELDGAASRIESI
ncbi:MAG TPA: PadR family transcriptional regulator [Caulobacteraceae bacterium]|nr:PadR family transcriptional regulator [Caulobacteraceae bacterium]